MNLVIRMIWLLLTVRRRSRLGATEEGRVTLRCWPNDLDTNMHMNNGRYLTIMDLGRLDLILRTGLLPVMRARKWFPVVGSAKVNFKRSINVFETFELTTRVIGWDDKWLYMEHRMERDGRVAAQAFIKGVFLGPDGKVATDELVAAIGHDGPSPALDPEMVAALA